MSKKYWMPIVTSMLATFNLAASESEKGFSIEPSARYRFQDVSDNFRGDAQASTLKLRLSASWQSQQNWQGFIQFDAVHAFNENAFNSVTLNRNTSPIPDPPGSELNQLLLIYQSDANWSLTVGRQSLGLDNERHIGKIEFWQNDQTFDALRFQYQDNLQWTINYLYLDNVRRIFGEDARSILSPEDSRFTNNPIRPVSELGEHQHNSHLLNLKYAISRKFKFSLYAYLLDNQSAAIFSSDTYGFSLSGDLKPQKIKFSYMLEYARQSGTHDNPWRYTADYLFLEGKVQYKSHQFSLAYENLGEDNGFGFATSLGTNHKFLGWADVFDNYAASGGIIDYHLTYQGRDGKTRWRLVAHQFYSAVETEKVGKEVDFEFAYRYTRDWEFKFIAARYVPDEGLDHLPASRYPLTTLMVSAAYNL